jgi:hypothetical protein
MLTDDPANDAFVDCTYALGPRWMNALTLFEFSVRRNFATDEQLDHAVTALGGSQELTDAYLIGSLCYCFSEDLQHPGTPSQWLLRPGGPTETDAYVSRIAARLRRP